MPHPKRSNTVIVVIAAAIAGVLVGELLLPLGVAIWVLYFVPIVLSAYSWRPSTPLYAAAVCSVLLVVAFFGDAAPDTAAAAYAPINRAFCFVSMWIAAAIARQLVNTRIDLARRDWQQAGLARLSMSTSGELTHAELGDRVVAFLADYLHAQVGAIYLMDSDAQLRRFGAYALDPQRAGPEVVRRGEGLVGQVARDNKILHLEEVPEGYLDVRSALGGHRPRHLVIAPAAVDKKVHAVVELGLLGEMGEQQIELLSAVSEPIAIAVRSATYRSRQQELLEETQRQAEELQTGEEELRAQNEELEQQSRSLQLSQAQLENQQTELAQINSQLEEHTRALKLQRDDLEDAHGALQRSNTYKSEFLANMSHELRTPLNSTLILAKLLLENRTGNLTTEQVKFASTIYSAGNDLLTLINDILDLSKIEAGKLDVRPENVGIRRLLDDLRAIFEPIAGDRGLELVIRADDDAPRSIHVDPTRLMQILRNLLSNALKFTERGRVALRVRSDVMGLAFEVEDTGIGIPTDQQSVIFEAFRQADGTSNRKYGGTGLGLSISRDLARMLGGDIHVRSTPRRGSVFTLLLPERYVASEAPHERPAGAPRTAAPAERAAVARRVSESSAAIPRPSAEEADGVRDDRDLVLPSARSILIVEDDAKFASILYDIAHELEFLAMVASGGDEALDLARRHRPSGIVLDIGLPDRSGLSVLDALKHDPLTRHIPVHVVSASDHARTALEMGAAGYAIKPVDRADLIEALQRLEAKFTQRLRRVLVVEDDDRHRESTCALLAGEGVETVAVSTATRALTELSSSTFDCMVLDLSLPDRTGFELLREMSEKEPVAFPPVIVYTGRSLSPDEEQELGRFSTSIIVKGARSPERLLDEVTLFLHQVESELPPERQRMLRDARHREEIFEGRRVLVVEDDVRNVFALTRVLEPRGATVEIARNGLEALAHLEKRPGVDLVLMDLMMPEMDGLTAMREIRKQPKHTKLPIIALTAKAMADDRASSLAAGANDYLAKPLDVDKLLSLARVWMPK